MSMRPHTMMKVGDVLRVNGKEVRVRVVANEMQRTRSVVAHVTRVFTCAVRASVAEMPCDDIAQDASVVAEFLRYHVLVRVFDGDPDAWLATLRERGGDDGDVRFVRRLRSRLRRDPALIVSIRRMVDATPFWHAREA
ncbi:MAG TPA: hypothetical protein VJZ00_10925 [Thermoanaerobaculia bacterium]|nr:hypothetical protein [Thermoanaerobaculia bacterium]